MKRIYIIGITLLLSAILAGGIYLNRNTRGIGNNVFATTIDTSEATGYNVIPFRSKTNLPKPELTIKHRTDGRGIQPK